MPGRQIMSNVRILVVDDMSLYRHVVTELFAHESGFEVVGEAENGREALTRIHLLNPDVVILDVEMPVMNGWETLRAIHLSYPELTVIIFSSLTLENDSAAEKAISLGASDFVTKPAAIDNQEAAWKYLRENLLTTVKLHA
jgi:two-component system chemotaxis response regulator CheB